MFKLTFYIPLFVFCFIGEICTPMLFPTVRIFGFLPFILFAVAELPLPKSLWCAAFSGLIMDLYSEGPPLGFFALNYSISTLIIYRYRKFFSKEKPFPFALLGVLFSFTSTLIHFFLYALFDSHLKISPHTFLTDLICMPIVDGAYSLIWILLPLIAIKYLTEPKRINLYKQKLGMVLNELSRITGK